MANAETTASENENLLDRDTRVQPVVLLNRSSGEGNRTFEQSAVTSALDDGRDEDIEKEFGVTRPGCALGVELDTEVWPVDMHNTLVTAVIGVDEEFLPAGGQAGSIDGVTVILRSDVTFSGHHACAGDIVTAVSELHFLCLGPDGSSEQLMAQANTEDGCAVLLNGGGNAIHGGIHDSRITRTVGDEQTIVVFSSERREVIVPRTHQDFYTALEEASQLVVLHTDVETEDANWAP